MPILIIIIHCVLFLPQGPFTEMIETQVAVRMFCLFIPKILLRDYLY